MTEEQMPPLPSIALVDRLRDTPNWQRETFGKWKTATSVYDRAPFEAADEIEMLASQCVAFSNAARENREIAESLRKDAERYRYLRNRIPAEVLGQVNAAAGCWIDSEDDDGVLVLLTGADADAAVDAAMSPNRDSGTSKEKA